MKQLKNSIYYEKYNHPEYYYSRKYHGFIKYQGDLIRIQNNLGCFFTSNSIDYLPHNLKVLFFIIYRVIFFKQGT